MYIYTHVCVRAIKMLAGDLIKHLSFYQHDKATYIPLLLPVITDYIFNCSEKNGLVELITVIRTNSFNEVCVRSPYHTSGRRHIQNMIDII